MLISSLSPLRLCSNIPPAYHTHGTDLQEHLNACIWEGRGDSWEWQITNLRCIPARLFWLLKVHITAVELVEPGGQIFLGDVLSLPLLEAFHRSVQLDRCR